jgi:hypothetical protein
MKRQVASLPESPARVNLEKTIAAMERQMAAGSGLSPAAAAATAESAAPRRVTAAGMPDAPPVADTMGTQRAQEAIRDPNALYTETVKNALIDAMLDHGGPIGIGGDEWLTIAAKDAEGPLSPNEPYDAATIVLRIKGSDLSAFRADRLTRDEARRRVEVREF